MVVATIMLPDLFIMFICERDSSVLVYLVSMAMVGGPCGRGCSSGTLLCCDHLLKHCCIKYTAGIAGGVFLQLV